VQCNELEFGERGSDFKKERRGFHAKFKNFLAKFESKKLTRKMGCDQRKVKNVEYHQRTKEEELLKLYIGRIRKKERSSISARDWKPEGT